MSGIADGEVDEFMVVLDDVDWGVLADEEIDDIRLAARAWLSGDARHAADIGDEDSIGVVFDVAATGTVAQYASAWLMNEINHQGSVSPTAAALCRLWVEVADRATDHTLRVEAMSSLGWVLTCASYSWPPFGFELPRDPHRSTFDEIDRGWPVYRRALDRGSPVKLRMISALMAPWMSDRNDVTTAIVDVFNGSDVPLEAASQLPELEARDYDGLLHGGLLGEGEPAEARAAGQLLRALGASAVGTDLADEAEVVLRRMLDAPAQLSDHACVGLARLRRLHEHDEQVVSRLHQRRRILAENPSTDGHVDELQAIVDALVIFILHCQPAWNKELDPQEEAELLIATSLDQRLASSARTRHGLPEPVMAADAPTQEPTSAIEVALQELVTRGQADGELALDEVLELFSGVEMSPEIHDQIGRYFGERGVSLR